MANQAEIQIQIPDDSKWSKRNQKWQQYICTTCPTLDTLEQFKSASMPVFPNSHVQLQSSHQPLSVGVPSTSRSVDTDSKSDDELSEGFQPAVSTKKEKNRIKRREERADPTYRDKERARARLRMQEKRKDPIYRELERMKNRLRMRILRSSGGETKSGSAYKSPSRRKTKQRVSNSTVQTIEHNGCHHSNAIQSLPTTPHHLYNFIK
ncbi:hypothetical protein CHUAL_012719 [Chamberlinius hualienensis]